MTTYVGTTYASPNGNGAITNDKVQAWCAKILDALVGAGLVQTADTGQINPATVTTQPSNTDLGYFVFRFDDSLQGTDPVFIRVMPGMGPPGYLRMRITVGQGSNGSGTITGTNTTVNIGEAGNGAALGDSTVYEMACHTEGYACLISRVGALDWRAFANVFTIARTKDNAGNFDGKGLFIFTSEQAATPQGMYMTSLRFASPAGAYSTHFNFTCMPNQPADTALLNGDKQLYGHFSNFPEIVQSWATFSVRHSELSTLPTTFSAAPYAGVQRTFVYMGAGGQGSRPANPTRDTNFCPAFLWE